MGPETLQRRQACISAQVLLLRADRAGATPGSPGDWRLIEELDAAAERIAVLGQLSTAALERNSASPGSPAQLRAVESIDQLTNEWSHLPPPSSC
jgi:hypothetical protein